MCFTIGVTILDSTTEIHLMLSSKFTFWYPVYIANEFIWLQIALVFLEDFYT